MFWLTSVTSYDSLRQSRWETHLDFQVLSTGAWYSLRCHGLSFVECCCCLQRTWASCGLHSHLPALHGNLSDLSCRKCQKSCLQFGPLILTLAGRYCNSVLPCVFISFLVLHWYWFPWQHVPRLLGNNGSNVNIALSAWQTCLSCVLSEVLALILQRRAGLVGWNLCSGQGQPAGEKRRGREKSVKGKWGNKGRDVGEESSWNTQRSKEDWGMTGGRKAWLYREEGAECSGKQNGGQ